MVLSRALAIVLMMLTLPVKAQDRLPTKLKQQLLLQQYESAMPQLKNLAGKGNAKASFLLGSLYAKGQGVEKDLQRAHKWLQRAHKQGNKEARPLMQKLGMIKTDSRKRVLKAVKQGKLNPLVSYYRDKGDMNITDGQGNTLLILAIKYGHQSITRYLLNNDAVAINAQNNLGKTALHIAVQKGDRALAQVLLNNEAKADVKDNSGRTAQSYAKAKGFKLVMADEKRTVKSAKVSQQLEALKKQADDENSPYFAWPLLSIAVLQKQETLVQWLLKQGHKPWKGQKHSAIAVAIGDNQVKMALKLIAKMNLNKVSVEQALLSTWFDKAIEHKQINTVKALMTKLNRQGTAAMEQWPIEQTPLWMAIEQNRHSVVNALLATMDMPGNNADYLLFALKNSRFDIAKTLVGSGFDLSKTDELGRGSLWYAADNGQSDLIEWLIRHKAPVGVADENGVTPLMRAIVKDCYACVGLLLLNGAEVARKSNTGNNALMFAAQGKVKILALLLKSSAAEDSSVVGAADSALSGRNQQSLTPLMLAVNSQSAECVVLLLAAGANPYRKNEQGQNAFDLASHQPVILAALNKL